MTIDELRAYGLRIAQPRDGYRFSLDPLILCDFAQAGEAERIIDLGTGSGVIPLVLARRAEGAHMVGVEHQEPMAELAERNVRLNALAERISILCEDVTLLKRRFPASSFDLVTANPPYRKRGTGRLSPKAGRDLARHESTATLADFLAVAKYLVKPSGSICLVYHPSRLVELFVEAAALKLAPLRLRMVHGNGRAEARMFLIELVKGRKGELKVLPPLFVYDDGKVRGEK
ncbi:MAG: tRNA1Val [Geobacteraceae bacterium]|nr:MAG: tRNA1Val [Geobacteraceae bacterium]